MTQLFFYKILFMIELLVAELLFTFRMPKRNKFYLRLTISIIILLFVAFVFPLNNIVITPQSDCTCNFDYLTIKHEFDINRANIFEAEGNWICETTGPTEKTTKSASGGTMVDRGKQAVVFDYTIESKKDTNVTLCVGFAHNTSTGLLLSAMFDSIVVNETIYTFGSEEGQSEDLLTFCGNWYTGWGNSILNVNLKEGNNSIILNTKFNSNYNIDYITLVADTLLKNI